MHVSVKPDDFEERSSVSSPFAPVRDIHLEKGLPPEGIAQKLEDFTEGRVVLCLPLGYRESRQTFWAAIRRQAAAQEVQVAVATIDPVTSRAARAAGLPVFPACALAKVVPWKMEPPVEAIPKPEMRQVQEPPIGENLKPPKKRRFPKFVSALHASGVRWWQPIVTLLVLIGVLLGIRHLVLTIVPSAVVTLVPAPEPVSASVQVTASPFFKTVDALHDEIPARIVSVMLEGEASIPTTGKKVVPDTPAKGTVTFRNKLSEEVVVPVGTIVSTSTGNVVRFKTVTTATLPAEIGATATAEIEAVEPGTQGNVPAGVISRIDGPLALSVWVINSAPTTGGKNRVASVVSELDKERLRVLLEAKLKARVLSSLKSKLKKGEFMPEDTITTKAVGLTYDHFVGEETPKLTLHMRMSGRGMAINGKGAESLVMKKLEERVPPAARLIPESVKMSRSDITVRSDGSVRFLEVAYGQMARDIDTETVRQSIKGLTVEEAKRVLTNYLELLEPPDIQLFPKWLKVKKIPDKPYRIQVRVVWKAR